jgi:menaquinone-dependent protoporphyrinogen IX oxidase
MRALVVYDSKFGNTREIALRIADAMKTGDVDVDVLSTVDVLELPEKLDLLVIGAPTQAHGVEATMREFLERLPSDGLDHLRVAVFDTRMRWPKLLSGSAAEGIAKRMTRLGAELVDEPESFFVADKEGPLREGETDRAADWGRFLLSEVTMHA